MLEMNPLTDTVSPIDERLIERKSSVLLGPAEMGVVTRVVCDPADFASVDDYMRSVAGHCLYEVFGDEHKESIKEFMANR